MEVLTYLLKFDIGPATFAPPVTSPLVIRVLLEESFDDLLSMSVVPNRLHFLVENI